MWTAPENVVLNSSANKRVVEGAFYVWTRKEFDMVLREQDAAIAAKYWGVQSNGNVDRENDPHDEFLGQVRGLSFFNSFILLFLRLERRRYKAYYFSPECFDGILIP